VAGRQIGRFLVQNETVYFMVILFPDTACLLHRGQHKTGPPKPSFSFHILFNITTQTPVSENPFLRGCWKMLKCKASEVLRIETYLAVRRSDEERG
jgi:hypothetical protein